jgi:alcohol dehydrogenase (cytochrome c)
MEGVELPEESTWQVVAYIRTLSVEGDPGGSTAEAAREVLNAITAVSPQRLVDAAGTPESWLMYSGDYSSQRHSSLREINRRNVGRLELKWMLQMSTVEGIVETTPLVVDGVMFLTEPPNNVFALDATSGAELWRYERPLEGRLRLCCGRVNRGLAVLGDRLFMGTLDAHLVALDIRTGDVIWDVPRADAAAGYSGTAAPLAVGDKVMIGIAGGEFGIRGFVDAYDAETGERVWRFHTVPAPGEPGSDTWSGDSWRTGGAPTWLTGSFDPDLNLLYWATGNPAPDYQGDERAGDNLYSNSVLALHPETGELAWHYQFTPHDVHDWDAVQIPVLADADFQGRPRKLMLFANRNAFFYVFDRETGELLLAERFARQNWAEGIGPDGRPVMVPGMEPSEEGTLTYPGDGATNWWSPSYSPRTGLLYVPVMNLAGVFFRGEEITQDVPGALFMGSTNRLMDRKQGRSSIVALIPQTGQQAWEHQLPAFSGAMTGILSTASDLVFTGHAEGGVFLALDATTGEKLWEASLGGRIIAAPMTYEVGGRQFVTIAAGRAVFTFGLN